MEPVIRLIILHWVDDGHKRNHGRAHLTWHIIKTVRSRGWKLSRRYIFICCYLHVLTVPPFCLACIMYLLELRHVRLEYGSIGNYFTALFSWHHRKNCAKIYNKWLHVATYYFVIVACLCLWMRHVWTGLAWLNAFIWF